MASFDATRYYVLTCVISQLTCQSLVDLCTLRNSNIFVRCISCCMSVVFKLAGNKTAASVDSRCIQPTRAAAAAGDNDVSVPGRRHPGSAATDLAADGRSRDIRPSFTASASAVHSPPFDGGYVSSPNYPNKYYAEAECRWTLTVQPTQTIRLTLLDFELDVRRGGQCHDVVRISYRRRRHPHQQHQQQQQPYRIYRDHRVQTSDVGGRTTPHPVPVKRPPSYASLQSSWSSRSYAAAAAAASSFSSTSSSSLAMSTVRAPITIPGGVSDVDDEEVEAFLECGSLGKQVIDVASDRVDVWFKTGQTGLAQRGFILYYEGQSFNRLLKSKL